MSHRMSIIFFQMLMGMFLLYLPSYAGDDQAPFTATLSNGQQVEFLGMTLHEGDDRTWWRPDGTIGDGDWPGAEVGSGSVARDDQPESTVRCTAQIRSRDGSISTTLFPSWFIDESRKRIFPDDPMFFSRPTGNTITQPVARDLDTSTVRMAVPIADWRTIATLPLREGEETVGSVEAVFFHAGESNGSAGVSAGTLRPSWADVWQVVAVDEDGNAHPCWQPFMSGGTGHFQVRDLPIARLVRFEFQTRRTEQVKFENVAMRPGQKTEVKVVTEHDPKDMTPSEGYEKRVFIPHIDYAIDEKKVILDLASGELIALPQGDGPTVQNKLEKMGKGDLAFNGRWIALRDGRPDVSGHGPGKDYPFSYPAGLPPNQFTFIAVDYQTRYEVKLVEIFEGGVLIDYRRKQ